MLPLAAIRRSLFAVLLLGSTITVPASSQTQAGPPSSDPATLRQQAQAAEKAQRYAEGIALAERAIALYESANGRDDPGLADYVMTLGRLRLQMRDAAGAIAAFERELQLRGRAAKPDEAAVAVAHAQLASALRGRGDIARADEEFKRAIAIQERLYGVDDPRNVPVMTAFANLQVFRGEYAAAEATLRRLVQIYETAKQTETGTFAQLLFGLGDVYFRTGAFEKAIGAFERCLAIREKLPNQQATQAVTIASLASVYQELGQFDRAEPLHRRVLEVYESAPTPPRLDIATVSKNLAMIRSLRGDPASAEPLLRRALQIREEVLGPSHTDVAGTLETMAVFYQSTGRPTEALQAMERSSEIVESNLRSVLTSGSEQQRLAYMTTVQENTDIALSLRQAVLSANTQATSFAASIVLRRKGRVLDAMATTMARFGARATPEERQLLDKLTAARGQLANLVLQPGESKPGEREQRVKALTAEIDAVESSLAAINRDLASELQAVNLADIQKQIPADTVLIEYTRYLPFNPKVIGRANRFGAPRFAVFALRSTGAPLWVELGSAETIDTRVTALRTALRSPTGEARLAARELARLILDPVESQLRGVRRVLVASDGELSVVPFAVLRDAGNHYLVERFEVANLASGRDLLSLTRHQAPRDPAVIVANPNFDAGTGPAAALTFRALPGTAEEAAALRALLPDARLIVQDDATEPALKQVKGPRLLHVATHGFFLDASTVAKSGTTADTRGVTVASAPRADTGRLALVRSGLALRGANHQAAPGADDGLLTALEAASLDLRGTQLVVLSACETGLGEVRSGDGVYGLRRALAMAGAETQMMSLWPVSDQGTRDLMIAFYKRLAARDGRAAALRTVQLQLLKAPKSSHPYFWAAFVVAGDWTPLRVN